MTEHTKDAERAQGQVFHAEVSSVARRHCDLPGYRVTLRAAGLEGLTLISDEPMQVGAAYDVTVTRVKAV